MNKAMPKVELHAHLNGSLSNAALQTLHNLKYGRSSNMDANFYRILAADSLDLSNCFQKFKFAHDLTSSADGLKIATSSVIKDFADDNVIYLELRTTPKSSATMSKKEYLETVIGAIRDARHQFPKIMVKLLPSIDRSKSVVEAEECVAIVLDLMVQHGDIIRGIDLSGDPLKGRFKDFVPILETCRNNHLKLALHCGEVDNEDEILEMLEFGMDRLGHGTFINDKHFEVGAVLDRKPIPIECCLTSNVKCGTVGTYDDHHFLPLFRRNYPVLVCTDDFGVFDTSLTQEFDHCTKTYDLSSIDLINLTRNAIDCSFATSEEQKLLHAELQTFTESFQH